MNKKNIFLVMMMVLGTGSMLPMQQLSAQDEAHMLERVRSLANNNLITIAQFSDGNTIDQYIAVLDKDSKAVVVQKSWNDGYLSRIGLGFTQMFAVINSAVSIGFGTVTGVVTYRAQNLWNSYVFSSVVDPRSYGTMVKDVYKEALNDPRYLKNIMDRPTMENETLAIVQYAKSLKMTNIIIGSGDKAIDRRNYETMVMGLIAPVTGVIGATCALAAVCGFVNAYQKNKENIARSILMQEQYDNNQVLIARLKQLKYDAGL